MQQGTPLHSPKVKMILPKHKSGFYTDGLRHWVKGVNSLTLTPKAENMCDTQSWWLFMIAVKNTYDNISLASKIKAKKWHIEIELKKYIGNNNHWQYDSM